MTIYFFYWLKIKTWRLLEQVKLLFTILSSHFKNSRFDCSSFINASLQRLGFLHLWMLSICFHMGCEKEKCIGLQRLLTIIDEILNFPSALEDHIMFDQWCEWRDYSPSETTSIYWAISNYDYLKSCNSMVNNFLGQYFAYG